MKNKLVILAVFLISLFTVGYVSAKTNNLELLGKIIYLDPGHGGIDPGAVYKDIKESEINLKIAQKTQKILEQKGAIVYLTRYGNYDLSVPNTINNVNYENEKIAKIFQETFKKNLNTNRKYKKRDNFYLTRRVERPGILIEVGFITNPNERYLLTTDSYQQKVANTILEAIIKYFS